MRLRVLKSVGLGVVAFWVVIAWLPGCSRDSEAPKETARPQERQPLTMCQGGVLAVLPLIAENRGFFRDAGLDVKLITKGDGKLSLEGLFSGDCTLSICGEPPLVVSSFKRNDFAILATLSTNENATKILARRDAGINAMSDLRGKVIGVRQGTLSLFFLDQLLKRYAIAPQQVSLRFLEPASLPTALADGTIAAYSATDELIFEGVRKLRANARVLAEPGLTMSSINLVARKEYLGKQPETARRVLKALLRAEEYISSHPDLARQIVQAARNLAPAEAESLLKDQVLSLALHKPLLLSLEDHARWMIEQKLVAGGTMPNMLTIIDPTTLMAIKPAAVSINR